MYIEILEKNNVKQTPEFTARVLSSEIGKLHNILIYIERFGSSGHLGDLKRTCSDILTMISLFIEQENYNIEEVRKMGLDNFDERIKEVREVELKRQYGDSEY